MAYSSLFLSLFYLLSSPLFAIVNLKGMENLYVLYPILQLAAYILYLIKDFNCDPMRNMEKQDFRLLGKKLEIFFMVFNILYVAFLLILSYLTMNIIILSFVLYPLGLKVAVADAMFIKNLNHKISDKIGE